MEEEKEVIITDSLKGFKNKLRMSTIYTNYYNSESWKCKNSPTGAHFWILGPIKYKNGMVVDTEKCKYCPETKTLVRKEY
jgi:hypothetical protein